MEAKRLRTWPFVATLIKMNLASAAAYRVSFLGQLLFMMLNNAIFLIFWWIFFTRFQRLGDWQLPDLLALFGTAAFAFGLSAVFMGNATRLGRFIVDGSLDAYLTVPRSPLLHILMSRMSPAAAGDMLFGITLFLCFTPDGLVKLPIFLLVGCLGAVTFVSFAVCAHSLTFFFGSAEGIGRLLHEAILTFSLYPETIFQGWSHALLFTALPAAFMSHLPVRMLRNPSPQVLLVLVIGAGCWAGLALAFFRYGLRHYESGNLVAPRS